MLEEKYDPDFGQKIKWDLDLLQGYDYIFVENVSANPGSSSYKGIDNPFLTREISDWNADLVLFYGYKFKGHWQAIKYFSGKIPVVFRGDSTTLNDGEGLKAFLKRMLLKYVYNKIDCALYVGKENKKYFLKNGMKEENLLFAPHAIDNNRFSYSASARKAWRDKLGYKDSDVVFLYVGKFIAIKNLFLLLKAFLKLETKSANLILVGSGELEHELKEGVNNSRVKFLPFQNQSVIPEIYSFADIFVLPSLSETWGLSVNEAMACGRAVIVSDKCGCAADLVEVGKNGFVFKSNSENELLNAMQKMVNKPDSLPKMGDYSLEIIKRYNYNSMAVALHKFLDKSV